MSIEQRPSTKETKNSRAGSVLLERAHTGQVGYSDRYVTVCVCVCVCVCVVVVVVVVVVCVCLFCELLLLFVCFCCCFVFTCVGHCWLHL